MSIGNNPESSEKETGRLEAFSDGVFSIAMTLLVLELKVPTIKPPVTPHAVFVQLAAQWPGYLAFVTSFASILIMWVNHHGIFRLIRRVDALLLFTNGLLLLLVTAVPFPTALVSSFLRTPGASAACVVYCLLFVVISFAYAMLIHAAARRGGHMLTENAMPELRRRLRDCYFVGMPCYLMASGCAMYLPSISLLICTLLWIFWSFGAIERGVIFRR